MIVGISTVSSTEGSETALNSLQISLKYHFQTQISHLDWTLKKTHSSLQQTTSTENFSPVKFFNWINNWQQHLQMVKLPLYTCLYVSSQWSIKLIGKGLCNTFGNTNEKQWRLFCAVSWLWIAVLSSLVPGKSCSAKSPWKAETTSRRKGKISEMLYNSKYPSNS